MLPFCYPYFQNPCNNFYFENQPPIFPFDFNFIINQNLIVGQTQTFQQANTSFQNQQQASKSHDQLQITQINLKNQNSEVITSPKKYVQKQNYVKLTTAHCQKKIIKKKCSKLSCKKTKSSKNDKAYIAKQSSKQQPSINCRYIQKNFELNIINQVFSFLWTEQKSRKFVKKYLQNETKVALYYEYIKTVRKFCKRYINKQYLSDLCNYQNYHIAYKMVAKSAQKLEYLSIKEFSKCIRHLIYTYLCNLCPTAIVTSKKIKSNLWNEHLIKCRLLKNFIFNGLSKQQYEIQLIHVSSN